MKDGTEDCGCLNLKPTECTMNIQLRSMLVCGVLAIASATGAEAQGFGAALLISGDHLFVGQPGEVAFFPVPPSVTGSVGIFAMQDGWTHVTSVQPANAVTADGFGQAIGTDGGVLVVGAAKRDGARGAAFVFQQRGDTWQEIARLDAPERAEGDGFGSAVGVSDDYILVGAPGRNQATGAVYVYLRSKDTWSLLSVLSAPSDDQGDHFGTTITVDGSRALISAPGTLPAFLPGAPASVKPGKVAVFDLDDGAWTETALITAEGSSTFGYAMTLDGDDALITAPGTNQSAAAVFQFAFGSAGWEQVGNLEPVGGVQGLGLSIARSGSTAVVGAPLASRALIFEHSDAGGWSMTGDVSYPDQFAFFGTAVATRGGDVLVGGPGVDFFEGVGVVYRREDSGDWVESTTLMADFGGLDAITDGVECTDGAVGDFTCQDVDLVAFIPLKDLGGDRGNFMNDLWGWTDPETGTEYGILGRNDGTAFVDLSDPGNPVYLGDLPLTEGATINLWRDMKVYANHAFIVADASGAHGVQIFDLTQLRNVSGAPVVFTETAHYDGIFSAHNIVINQDTGFAYVVGASGGGNTCGGGLHMIDVRDPVNPVFAGCFQDLATGNSGTGYSHDAQCIVYHGPDTDYADHEICFGSNETALSIADVTDKENPVAISNATYPNVSYAHQGWTSDDHRFFFMNDEGDEMSGEMPGTRTLVFDIEDLDDPILINEHFGATKATDHNLYVRGQFMYQSNYVSGLRIIDISDPENLQEVGHFDTVPWGEDNAGFAGSWSNYPFFESGIILVSSMREGLFILRKRRPTVF